MNSEVGANKDNDHKGDSRSMIGSNRPQHPLSNSISDSLVMFNPEANPTQDEESFTQDEANRRGNSVGNLNNRSGLKEARPSRFQHLYCKPVDAVDPNRFSSGSHGNDKSKNSRDHEFGQLVRTQTPIDKHGTFKHRTMIGRKVLQEMGQSGDLQLNL